MKIWGNEDAYLRAVLGLSFVVEGYSLFVATRAVMAGATAHGLTFMQYLRRGLDPTSIAVMMEDGAAVAGLAIAGNIHLVTPSICYFPPHNSSLPLDTSPKTRNSGAFSSGPFSSGYKTHDVSICLGNI